MEKKAGQNKSPIYKMAKRHKDARQTDAQNCQSGRVTELVCMLQIRFLTYSQQEQSIYHRRMMHTLTV